MIYFIEAVGAGLVKIGFTEREVADRLRELQTASPHRLRIAATMPGGLNDESELHRRFDHLCVGGEWFKMEVEIHAAIACLGFIQPIAKQVADLRADLEKQLENFRRVYGIEPVFRDGEPPMSSDDFIFADEQVTKIDERVNRIECELGKLGWAFQGCIPPEPKLVITDTVRRAVLADLGVPPNEINVWLNRLAGERF